MPAACGNTFAEGPVKRLKNEYLRFHGHGPRWSKQARFRCPKGLIVLGEAVAVEYRCDKRNGGGDGKKAVYRHEFDRGAADETMKGQLYILGGRIKVTAAGIEH